MVFVDVPQKELRSVDVPVGRTAPRAKGGDQGAPLSVLGAEWALGSFGAKPQTLASEDNSVVPPPTSCGLLGRAGSGRVWAHLAGFGALRFSPPARGGVHSVQQNESPSWI